MATSSTCSNCTYFVPTSGNRGECRRYPPEPTQDYRRFAMVVLDDWCGEWSKKT